MIEETLKYIEDQTGLRLILCSHFTGVKELAKELYFNVALNEKTSESKDFDKLKRLSDRYGYIKVEPNGVKRLAIFPYKNQSK